MFTADTLVGPVCLAVRQRATVVAEMEGPGPAAPMALTFSVGTSEAGEAFIAELSWACGKRSLHMLPPLNEPVADVETVETAS